MATMTTSSSTLRGGAWLLEPSDPEGVLTPEKLTDEQRLIGQTAEEFVAKEVLPQLDRLEQKDWTLARQLVKRCGELGLLGVDAAEAYGGVQLDKVSSLIVSERLAKSASFGATLGAQVNLWVRAETVQLLEGDEPDRLVERAGRVVAAGIRARRAERLRLEVADASGPAPALGLGDERPPDAAAMFLLPDAHHMDLGCPRRVLLEAEETEFRLHRQRRERRRVLDVLASGLLDPEPVGQVAEHGFCDA